jgi:hypothetical protein
MSSHILKQVREAVEQLNPSEVRNAAERPIVVRTAATSTEGYVAIERFLVGGVMSRRRRVESLAAIYRTTDEHLPETGDLDIVEKGIEAPEGTLVFDPAKPELLVAAVIEAKQDLGLCLARAFPPFRRPVTDRIIGNVAKENALFSIMTALPGIAPGLNIPWAVPETASDTAVLTVNQIRMAFLLAAASDRPVGYREQKGEIASVIAGAFGWRTLARELAGRIPLGGGVIPKAAIAFAGTYVAGLSLERLYRVGYGLTRAERRLAYGEALGKGRQVAAGLLDSMRRRKAG